MKKILIALFLLIFTLPTHALVLDTRKAGITEKCIQDMGYKILNANSIPYRTNFLYVSNKNPNAYTSYRNKTIVVYDGTIRYIQYEEELAAILAHEISHLVDTNQGIFRGQFSGLSYGLTPQKYETKADKRAVDYLVKAGYHPVALIVALHRLCDQPRYDWYLSHPLGSKRVAQIYEYIYTKYPQYLVNNPYKDDILYQNFLLTSKENRKKLEQKVKSNSKRQVNYL